MYSRRTFLKWLGGALVSSSLRPAFAFFPEVTSVTSGFGRALTALPVYERRDTGAPIVTHHWPDSRITLHGIDGDWYRVTGGYVRREQVQPIAAHSPEDCRLRTDYPFWAEVAGTVASVRAFCAADAPLVTRIGHGGVVRVVGVLPGEPYGWYEIADSSGTFVGWSQASHWHPVEERSERTIHDKRHIYIDRQASIISAYEAGQLVLETSFSAGAVTRAGIYFVERVSPGGGRWEEEVVYHGLPWQMRFSDGQVITGAYWHNRFGGQVPGPAVQLPPAAAHWLYGFVGSQTQIEVK